MFIPVGDSPNPPGTPVVNYALIALNVAIFVLVTLPMSVASPAPDHPMLAEYVELVRQNVGRGFSTLS